MILLDGRPVARAIIEAVREEMSVLAKQVADPPEIAVLLPASDAGARSYLRSIRRIFDPLDITVIAVELADDTSAEEFRQAVSLLNVDARVTGIIALQPLPPAIDRRLPALVIDPAKDIDGVTIANAGRLALGLDAIAPSTPAGGIEILRHYGIPVEGRHAVVIGRSSVVGKPLAQLLLAADATVTVCHRRTANLAEFTRRADIVAAAAGRAGLVTRSMVRPGATVIDFGVNLVAGRLVGDVDPDVAEVAGALTPVPRGTGLVTTAVLARNAVRAAARQLGIERGVLAGQRA